jgi:hypothetical protein
MEPWMPIMVAFVLYGYVTVFNRMMKNPVDTWMDIPRIYT